MEDEEANRFSARAARYARVGANAGGVAARIAGARLVRWRRRRGNHAAAFAQALGGLKGPMMKVAQMMATIPDFCRKNMPRNCRSCRPMRRRWARRSSSGGCRRSLGPDWRSRFAAFDMKPAAAASLGQVHRAAAKDGAALACKLQYPDMKSTVEADLRQLDILFALHRRLNPVIDTREMTKEIGARVREELDYGREAKHAALYRDILADFDDIRVPRVRPELSSARLLTMDWLEGENCSASRAPEPRAPHRARRCSRHGGFRSSGSASSTATRILAIIPFSAMTANTREAEASICSIMAAFAFLRQIRRRRHRTL